LRLIAIKIFADN